MRSATRLCLAACLLFGQAFVLPRGSADVTGLARAAGAARGLEGRWLLVEQTYEGGSANLAAAESPVRLEFTRDGGRLEGRIWAGADTAGADRWPAFRADAGPIAVREKTRTENEGSGLIEVRYSVQPAAGDDLVLDIVERYELAADGDSLSGTMTVTFTGGESHRGGFTLHRRFARER